MNRIIVIIFKKFRMKKLNSLEFFVVHVIRKNPIQSINPKIKFTQIIKK